MLIPRLEPYPEPSTHQMRQGLVKYEYVDVVSPLSGRVIDWEGAFSENLRQNGFVLLGGELKT
jgi:hypothetical protein